jgi:hypothetical protein
MTMAEEDEEDDVYLLQLGRVTYHAANLQLHLVLTVTELLGVGLDRALRVVLGRPASALADTAIRLVDVGVADEHTRTDIIAWCKRAKALEDRRNRVVHRFRIIDSINPDDRLFLSARYDKERTWEPQRYTVDEVRRLADDLKEHVIKAGQLLERIGELTALSDG